MKDYYRLGVNPFVPEDGWAQGNVNYSLRHDGYWFMVPIGQPFEVSSDVYNEAFRLCLQDGKYTTNPACPEDQKSPYYRVVIGK
ncbi:MAG: hypothetical protein H6766_04730 [Candidatus Peribacteria bacterium]|nr:MAG: hypothetical protein H6766_04730 [Candidatus Peribacteria bacterium]